MIRGEPNDQNFVCSGGACRTSESDATVGGDGEPRQHGLGAVDGKAGAPMDFAGETVDLCEIVGVDEAEGFGVNVNWIAITNNMFAVADNAFGGVKMWIIDKSTALVPGGPITLFVFDTGFVGTLTGFGALTLQLPVTVGTGGTLYIVDN